MKKYCLILCILLQTTAFAGIPIFGQYQGPTKQLIKRESKARIERKLSDMEIPKQCIPFFDAISEQEEWGHLGYHGAAQEFRIYQDIIRFTIEEIVGIPVREDFHFLRVPGDASLNLNSMEEFEKFWGKIDNKTEERAKQLLSMNFAIYSNFDQEGSCSLHLFTHDKSKHTISFTDALTVFYEKLGISTEEIAKLFSLGHTKLNKSGGILLQIAENSHLTNPCGEAYDFADRHGYPSKKGGYPFGMYPLSNHYLRMMTDLYVEHFLDVAPQFRLLINNRYTLNPYSSLIVKRWDFYSNEEIYDYEESMRTAIRRLRYDVLKVEKYKKELDELWLGV